MLQNFGEFFKSDNAPNPQEIATTGLEILEINKEKRPIRKVTGFDYGTNELNNSISQIRTNHIMKNLQMCHLTRKIRDLLVLRFNCLTDNMIDSMPSKNV